MGPGKCEDWWATRDLRNVQFVHFRDLKNDLMCEIALIADFLGIEYDAETMQRIIHCTFDYMKVHAAEVTRLGGIRGRVAAIASSIRALTANGAII